VVGWPRRGWGLPDCSQCTSMAESEAPVHVAWGGRRGAEPGASVGRGVADCKRPDKVVTVVDKEKPYGGPSYLCSTK